MPSARLAGGHRLYDADDVARLYRIIRLCPLGFPLSQVADVLAEPEWQLAPAIERHLSLYVQSASPPARLGRNPYRPNLDSADPNAYLQERSGSSRTRDMNASYGV